MLIHFPELNVFAHPVIQPQHFFFLPPEVGFCVPDSMLNAEACCLLGRSAQRDGTGI